jgi:hypothetical protein
MAGTTHLWGNIVVNTIIIYNNNNKPSNDVLLVKIEGPGAGIPFIIIETCC